MLVAEVHGRERAADVGLGASDGRLCCPHRTMREAAAGKAGGRGGHATQHACERRRLSIRAGLPSQLRSVDAYEVFSNPPVTS
jgi:hypothetical protein